MYDNEFKLTMTKFEIKLPNGIVLSSELTEGVVSKLPDVQPREIGNGYVWYLLPTFEIDAVQVVFDLCFWEGNLKDINLSLSNPDLYGNSWNDFSEAKETLRAKHTEKWLASKGYSVGKYTWGSVWAGYDGKGGVGHAVVRYNS